MTVSRIKNDYDIYNGLSTDSKPTSSVNIGSRFYETDTGELYTYNGSSWVEIHPYYLSQLEKYTDLGKISEVSDYVTSTSSRVILLIVGANPPHTVFEVTSSVDGVFQLTEDVSVTSSGTQLSIYNRKRNAAASEAVDVYHTPTTSSGTIIHTSYLPAKEIHSEEWILKANTNYLATYTLSTGAGKVNTHIYFYTEAT